MAKRGGKFNFAKRAKELKKQKKRQEKLERKRAAAESGVPVEAEIVSLDDLLNPPPPSDEKTTTPDDAEDSKPS